MPRRPKIEIGDRITFTVTTRDGRRKATRKVTGFSTRGHPEVTYNGWNFFEVGWAPNDKIHSVEKH